MYSLFFWRSWRFKKGPAGPDLDCFFYCCFFLEVGRPGGGFGAPGGDISNKRSGGKPPLLLRVKNPPTGAPKPKNKTRKQQTLIFIVCLMCF